MVAGGTTTNYAYNADDELCATSSGTPSCSTPNYAYDGNGNLTSSPVFSALTYNTKNQTTSRTPVGGAATNYSYADADQSERVSISSNTLAWSPLGLAEESPHSGIYYTNDPTGSTLGDRETDLNSNYYFLYDGLGSVVGVMDANGVVGKTYSYDAFGNTTVSGSAPEDSNLRFASGYHEPAPHNLYQFGTRSYDPTIGRWTQQDPYPGSIDGPAESDPYLYVGDDPVNHVDPSGLCWSGLCWAKHAAQTVGCAFKRHPFAMSAAVVLGAAGIAAWGIGGAALLSGGIESGVLAGLGAGEGGLHAAGTIIAMGSVAEFGSYVSWRAARRRC